MQNVKTVFRGIRDNWLRSFIPAPVNVNWTERLRACCGALLGLLATSYISQAVAGPSGGLPLLIAPMGASAILLFAAPASPLAQPWSVVGGNIMAALIGVACAQWIDDAWLAASVAVPLAIALMFMLRCLHPPSGAVALTAVLGGPEIQDLGYSFALVPVGLNSMIILLTALVFNNATRRRYPHASQAVHTNTHETADSLPSDRVGFTPADLDEVLKQYNQFLDVSRDDLDILLRQAEMKAYHRRFGEITCADIMSRDVVTVEPGTRIPQVWATMRQHLIKAVPVIDGERKVVGIITQTDFLTHAQWSPYHGVIDNMRRAVKRRIAPRRETAKFAADIMTQPVKTASGRKPIVELVPLMSDAGMHHIPIVDDQGHLIGIVTQSDLVAGLYRGRLSEQVAA